MKLQHAPDYIHMLASIPNMGTGTFGSGDTRRHSWMKCKYNTRIRPKSVEETIAADRMPKGIGGGKNAKA